MTRPLQFSSAMFMTLILGALCFCSHIDGDGTAEKESFSLSMSDFTVDLLKALTKSSADNVLFSPSSVNILLSQLQQGAAGKTEEQLNGALHRNSVSSREGYSQFFKSVAMGSKGVLMNVATKTVVKPDFPINDNFKTSSINDFGAEIENLDLASPGAAITINKWVSSATQGHIKDLVSEGSLTPDSVMVLLSAVYFKGKWKEQFRRGRSAAARFFVGPNASVEVPYMLQSKRMVAGINPELGAKWVQLPYQEEEFAMLLVLPTVDHELDAVIQKLTGSDLKGMISSWNTRHVRLRIPKFNLNINTQLKNALKSIGLTDMFTDSAQFPGISQQGTKVSDAIHRAFLEVNEEGSEAAASTALVVNTLSLTSHLDEFQFTANQPFLAIIVDKSNNMPHFVAKVVNPS